jgi:integrase
MARGERILSARTVASLVAPGRHSDGGGLYLYIGEDGRRRWIYRYPWKGKTREMGLGSASAVGLKEARDARDKWRAVLKGGVDPITERNASNQALLVPTFRDCSEKLIEAKAKGWKSAKHKAQWTSTLETHARSIMDRPVDKVDLPAVLGVLKPIWTEKAETASRVRGRIEAVIDWAKAHGHCVGENPARWRGHLDKILSKRQMLTRGHFAAMAYNDLPAFLTALREREAIAARALEFAILTACRSGEVLGARWDEIDIENGVWSISPARMKAGRLHRVPLSTQAMAIVRAMEAGDDTFVFSLRRGKPMSGMAFEMLMRRMGVDGVTVHGFRSSFRDWVGNETAFPREIAEAALAHVVGDKAEQAYRRSDALEKRRALMQAWADFLSCDVRDKVVPLKRKTGD